MGETSITLDIPLSIQECDNIVEEKVRKEQKLLTKSTNDTKIFDLYKINNLFRDYCVNPHHHRHIISMLCRWKTDAFITKYVKNVHCICRKTHFISPYLILHTY